MLGNVFELVATTLGTVVAALTVAPLLILLPGLSIAIAFRVRDPFLLIGICVPLSLSVVIAAGLLLNACCRLTSGAWALELALSSGLSFLVLQHKGALGISRLRVAFRSLRGSVPIMLIPLIGTAYIISYLSEAADREFPNLEFSIQAGHSSRGEVEVQLRGVDIRDPLEVDISQAGRTLSIFRSVILDSPATRTFKAESIEGTSDPVVARLLRQENGTEIRRVHLLKPTVSDNASVR